MDCSLKECCSGGEQHSEEGPIPHSWVRAGRPKEEEPNGTDFSIELMPTLLSGEAKGASPALVLWESSPFPPVGAKAAVGMAQAWEKFCYLQGPSGKEDLQEQTLSSVRFWLHLASDRESCFLW